MKQFIRETDLGGTLAFGLDLAYVIFKVKFTTSNIGLNYCARTPTGAPGCRQIGGRERGAGAPRG